MELKRLLDERGVALVVRISPTTAQHYPKYLPSTYDRFVKMKRTGEYFPNWYEVFTAEIKKVEVTVYDQYDLLEQMKADGQLVFTKGGIHWSNAPMADYINGLNECFEGLLGKKIRRMVKISQMNIVGQMGVFEDRDLWDVCWNIISAEPDYPSANIIFSSEPGEFTPNVFAVGQSFTPVILRPIYDLEQPISRDTCFSWYNSCVMQYPSEVPQGTKISETTEDFELYLSTDVIVIELLETYAAPDAVQFQFVSNMVNYLKGNGA